MRRILLNLVGMVIALTAIAALGAGPAAGAGYCGTDSDAATACPIPTSETVNGLLSEGNGLDYYVFFARKGTQLTLTVNDTQDPACETGVEPYTTCTNAAIELLDSRGNQLTGDPFSQANDGVPVPATVTKTVAANGTYYAVVNGTNVTGPAPYSLAVSGSPNVTWPHPCVVPKLRRHANLGTARHDLALASCRAGRVRRVFDGAVPRGDVVRLRPGAGAIEPPGAQVGITVSRG